MNPYANIKKVNITKRQEQKNFYVGSDFCKDHSFYTFDKPDGEYLFKKTTNPYALASEVFHTQLGNRLGLPVAQNSPAVMINGDKTTRGILSKNFMEQGESFHPTREFVCNESALDWDNVHCYNIPYLPSKDSLTLQSVNLGELTKILNKNFDNPKAIKKGLAQNFLMSHVAQTIDTVNLHNTGILLPTQNIAPAFDFGSSASFYKVLDKQDTKLHKSNITFLQRTQSQLVEEFADNASAQSKRMDEICDFTALLPLWNNSDKTKELLCTLSESIPQIYSKRLARLSNAFSRKAIETAQ